MKNLTEVLTINLAVFAAIVAAGTIAGDNMWPFICTYWITLTLRNTLAAVEAMKK